MGISLIFSLCIEPVEDCPSARVVVLGVPRVDGPDEHQERPRRGVPPVHDADLVLGLGAVVVSLGVVEGGKSGRFGGLLGLSANACEDKIGRSV